MGFVGKRSVVAGPVAHGPVTLKHSKATINDLEAMVSVYLDAFSENRLAALMYGSANPEELTQWLVELFGLDFEQPEMMHYKVTEHDNETGTQKLVAWLRYEIPREGKTCADDEKGMTLSNMPTPLGVNLDLLLSARGALKEMDQKYLQYGHMCIGHHLAVLPSHQNKGVGQMLVRQFIKVADHLGKPIYIHATAEGLPLYRKYGCRTVDLHELDLSEWAGQGTEPERDWIMVREVGGRIDVPQSIRTDDAQVLKKLREIEGPLPGQNAGPVKSKL